MPVMDGFEMAKKLKGKMMKKEIPFTPIIGYSAFVSSEDVEKCFQNGMDAHMSKPKEYEDLKEELLQILQNRNKFSQSFF
jgi:CheY-like chemotaxis protein